MPTDDKNRLLAELTEAIRLDPHDAKSLARRAKCLSQLFRDFDKALADANEAIRIDPLLDDAWAVRGLIRLRRQEDDAALNDLNEAIRLNPNNVKALTWRGYIQCSYMDQDEAAEHDLTEAIRLAPDTGYAYLARARANWHLDRPELALADYDKAISLPDPSGVVSKDRFACHAYFARGQYYKCHGFLALAIADFTEAIRLSTDTRLFPERAHAFLERGNAYFRKGDLSQAIEDFTEVIRLEPEYYRAYQSRARAFRTLGDNLNAQQDEDKARELRRSELGLAPGGTP